MPRSNYLRGYPAAQQAQQAQMEAPKADLSKCPRCRKEYLSTINYRRCMSSHLGASGSKAAARGVAGASAGPLAGRGLGLRGCGSWLAWRLVAPSTPLALATDHVVPR